MAQKDFKEVCTFSVWTTAEEERNFEVNGTQGLKNVATNEAQLNRPSSEDTSRSVAEEEILAIGKVYCDSLKKEAIDCMQELENRQGEIKAFFRQSDIKQQADDSLGTCDSKLVNLKNIWKNYIEKARVEMEALKERYISYKREVESFKQAYNIPRDAIPADFKAVLIAGAVTLAAVIFEVIVNGKAVGSVSIGGQNYGLLIAIIVASINVVASGFVGYTCVKHVNDINVKSRRKYIFLSYLYGIVVIYLNWAYAAFREVSEQTMKDVLAGTINKREALAKSFTEASTPWDVTLSLPSIGLFLLGLFFAGVSIYKYYQLNDTIPGYGSISRKKMQAEKAINNYESDKTLEKQKYQKETTEAITKLLEKTKNDIKESRDKCRKYNAELNIIYDIAQQKEARFKTFIEQCNDGVVHMMKEFRKIINTNQTARDPGWTPPEYWSNPVSLKLDDYHPDTVFEMQKPVRVDDVEKAIRLKRHEETFEKNYNESFDKLINYQKEIYDKIGDALK